MLELDVQDGVGVTGLQARACGSRHFDTRGGIQNVSDPTAARWQSMVLFLAEFKRRDDETSGGTPFAIWGVPFMLTCRILMTSYVQSKRYPDQTCANN